MPLSLDLRSDTLTQPTEAMRAAMLSAPVGDDVYGEDPSINALQEQAAALFGKEAALFCPSGTMCNQIAIRLHTRPQDEVICDQWAHIYLYEGGGIASNALCSVRLLPGDRGRISAEQVEAAIQPDNPHFPRTRLVALENTSNKGGGSCYDLAQIAAVRAVCDRHGLALHLDGARVMNACVAAGYSPAELGQYFDTISLCLSKGLGAPVGSVLLGSREHIHQALRVRKVMGGGMRQAGMLAAAASYALTHHVERLSEDHRRARQLGETLQALPWVAQVMPVETNIVVFRTVADQITREQLLAQLNAQDIQLSTFGADYLRFVTHLHVDEEAIGHIVAALQGISEPGAVVSGAANRDQ
jgi:threonine aldolase